MMHTEPFLGRVSFCTGPVNPDVIRLTLGFRPTFAHVSRYETILGTHFVVRVSSRDDAFSDAPRNKGGSPVDWSGLHHCSLP